MQINKVNFNISKTATPKIDVNKTSTSTNPFGVSFKGNIIQADVFETTKQPSLKEKMATKGKLFSSAVISGINSFNESFKSRMNAIVSFGRKTTSNIFESFDKLAKTEVSIDLGAFVNTVNNKLFPDNTYKVNNLVKQPVSDLKTLWTNEMSRMEAS